MKKLLLIALASGLCLASPAGAEVLFQDSFEYGNTTQNIQDVSAWVTGSGVVMYDHDGGLTTAGLDGEAGGSMHHDYGSGNRGGPVAVSVNPFPGTAAGSEWWFAGLLQVANNDGTTSVTFSNGQSVNHIGFGSDANGNIVLIASNNGGSAAAHDTGLDVTLGETILFIVRGTKGTGTSPTNSFVDIWVNPSDTSSVAALGTPTWGTGTDSKFGRETGAYTSVSVGLSFQSRADEIRMGETLSDVVIPEPATMSLLALGGLAILRRRRAA